MKRIYKIISILLLVLILGLMAVFNFKKKRVQTIIDYYNTLPASFFFDKDLGNIKYPLNQKNSVWTSNSIEGYELTPIVDLKNGYVEINDEGTGGGNVLIKVFLFRKSTGLPIIALSKGGFDGFYFDSSTQFYKMQNKKWVKAKDVFPKFSIEQFLNKNHRDLFFQKESFITKNLTLLIELSRYDATATIKPNFNKYDYLVKSNYNIYSEMPFTNEEQKQLLEVVKNISGKTYQLSFNKLLGRFELIDSILVDGKRINPKVYNEEVIYKKLSKLKVVKELAFYIDSASQKERSLKLVFDNETQDDSKFITVKAVEDNGSNFVTHLIFQVQKDNLEITLYNPIKDNYEKIEK